MIIGRLADHRPTVEGRVWCPALDFRQPIDLVVDITIERTRVSLADMFLDPLTVLPMDDVEIVRLPGMVSLGFVRRCIISFQDDSGLFATANVDVIFFDGDADESRLGRDVLDEWLMVFDGPARTIVFDAPAN